MLACNSTEKATENLGGVPKLYPFSYTYGYKMSCPHSAAGWVGFIYTVVEYKGKESSAKGGGGAQVVEYSCTWCVLLSCRS